MRSLTVLFLCLICPALRAQSLMDRVSALEAQTARLNAIERDVADIKRDVADMKEQLKLMSPVAGGRPADPFSSPSPEASASPPRKGSLSYKEARAESIRRGEPLYVWVAYKCPSSADQLSQGVHCHVSSFEGDATRRVVVGVPEAGECYKAGVVGAPDCCAAELQRTAQHGVALLAQKNAPVATASAWGGAGMRAAPQMGGFRSGGG